MASRRWRWNGTAWVDITPVTFSTISVAGQSDVVADSSTDTLTLAAGTGVTITTTPGTDTVTLSIDQSVATSATPTFAKMLLGGGTVGAPTLAHTGDSDAGVNFPSADVVQLVTGAAARLEASSTGVAVTGDLTVTGKATITGDVLSTNLRGFNHVMNGAFQVKQRAATSTTTSGAFVFDRWFMGASTGTVTYSQQTSTLGSPPIAGFENELSSYARMVTTGQSGAGAYAILYQSFEGVRYLSGETVTVSFWAKAASGTPKVAIEWEQAFGSGGSPSAGQQTYGGQVTLSTSWVRYEKTFTIASVSGKTIGTTADTDSCNLNLWVSGGTTYNSRHGTMGIQSNTFDFWGVKVERGIRATPFEMGPYSDELRRCQYWFQSWTNPPLRGVVTGAISINRMACTIPTMRHAAWTFTYSGTSQFYDGTTSCDQTAAPTAVYKSRYGMEFDITVSTGMGAAGRACTLYNNGSANTWTLSCEYDGL